MAIVQRVTTTGQARALAEHLLGTDRRLPSVVVTAGAGDGDGLISAQNVADDVGELAEVWWMRTGDPTWEFKAAMPDLTQVFGDAARVYALDDDWKTNAYASRLYMCGTESRARVVEDELVADAMEAAGRAGLLKKRVAAATIVSGKVTGFPAAGRALVRGDFGFATIRSELVPGSPPVERLLHPGMEVRGRYDDRDKLIDISESVRPAAEALADCAVGDTVLVRVKTVGSSVVAVEIYPHKVVEMRVAQVTGNDRDDLRDLMSVGEVVAARVDRTESWILSMLEVDDFAEIHEVSLLPGGPGWLEQDEPVDAEASVEAGAASVAEVVAAPVQAAVETPAVKERVPPTAPVPGPQAGQIVSLQQALERQRGIAESLQAETAQLLRSLEHLEDQRRRDERTIEQLKTRQRGLLKKSRKADASVGDASEAFNDPVLQLRHDVYLAWVAKIPAGEKGDKPLPETWMVGPHFCDSVAAMKPEVRDKVPEVVVEILLGIAERSDAREMHPLRTSIAGDAAAVSRDDGATCWRVSVQRRSPSAARLHFWRRPGHPIELSRVGVHDDLRP